MRLTAFFKLYNICILLHRCNLKIFAKNQFEKISNFRENSAKNLQMSHNLQNFAKFQNFQLKNRVDFEKCCKTRIFLQISVPIQPKTSNILPKICQKLATTLQLPRAAAPDARRRRGERPGGVRGAAARRARGGGKEADDS